MKLARLRQLRDSLPIIEVEQEFLFAATVLVHIERLPSVRVLAKKSWAMSDMFEAIFECHGHRFLMQLPFGCIVIAAIDTATPGEVIDELVAHLDNYRTVWPTQLLWAMARYFCLPFNAAPVSTGTVQ